MPPGWPQRHQYNPAVLRLFLRMRPRATVFGNLSTRIAEDDMRRDDLMKPDVLSEIVLIASGVALFLPLLLMLIMSITHIPIQ
jgi:hypothetical protein